MATSSISIGSPVTVRSNAATARVTLGLAGSTIRRRTPVQAPSCGAADLLHAEFGTALDDRATKMLVGTAIAGVMKEAGFEAVSTGERIPANVAGFRTGARYVHSSAEQARSVANAADITDDILLTMLAALSGSQRKRLVQMIADSPT